MENKMAASEKNTGGVHDRKIIQPKKNNRSDSEARL